MDGFTDTERATLASVLDEIIPPSADGRLPGAGEVGVATHVDRALANLPDLRTMVARVSRSSSRRPARGTGARSPSCRRPSAPRSSRSSRSRSR